MLTKALILPVLQISTTMGKLHGYNVAQLVPEEPVPPQEPALVFPLPEPAKAFSVPAGKSSNPWGHEIDYITCIRLVKQGIITPKEQIAWCESKQAAFDSFKRACRSGALTAQECGLGLERVRAMGDRWRFGL